MLLLRTNLEVYHHPSSRSIWFSIIHLLICKFVCIWHFSSYMLYLDLNKLILLFKKGREGEGKQTYLSMFIRYSCNIYFRNRSRISFYYKFNIQSIKRKSTYSYYLPSTDRNLISTKRALNSPSLTFNISDKGSDNPCSSKSLCLSLILPSKLNEKY